MRKGRESVAWARATHLAAANDEYFLIPNLPGEDQRAAAFDLGELFFCHVDLCRGCESVGGERKETQCTIVQRDKAGESQSIREY